MLIHTLIRFINEHAGSHDYAVVIARTKVSKTEVKRKVWLRCDRGGKSGTYISSPWIGLTSESNNQMKVLEFRVFIIKRHILMTAAIVWDVPEADTSACIVITVVVEVFSP